MALRGKLLHFVVNFLIGMAWASVFIGAYGAFVSSLHLGFVFAIIASFVGMLPGFVALLLLEHFIAVQQIRDEIKRISFDTKQQASSED